jgi:hypothetical protein
MAQRKTQPLTEVSTRNISWEGKLSRSVRLTNRSHMLIILKSVSLNFLELSMSIEAITGIVLLLTMLNL